MGIEDSRGVSRDEMAMALLIQPLVDARASGGGMSLTADGGMLLSATWGLGLHSRIFFPQSMRR